MNTYFFTETHVFMPLSFCGASLAVTAEIPSQGVVWTCGLHGKRLTARLLTCCTGGGQRMVGRRDAEGKGGVDRGKHGGAEAGCQSIEGEEWRKVRATADELRADLKAGGQIEWGTRRLFSGWQGGPRARGRSVSMRLTGSRGSSLFDTAPPQETGSGTGKKYNTGLSQSYSPPGSPTR